MLSKAINPADARLKPLTLQEIHHHNLGQSVPQPTHDLETKLPLSPKQVYHAPPPHILYYQPTIINHLSSPGHSVNYFSSPGLFGSHWWSVYYHS